MGYGKALADALRVVIRLGGGVRPIGWRARLSTSHPPARTRVARIEAMLRHPTGALTRVARCGQSAAMSATVASSNRTRSSGATPMSRPRLPPLT